MKLSIAFVALIASVFATPIPETADVEERGLEKRQAINYVQNYNGNLANFQYNEGTGGIYASWNNPSDFVIGLGWSTGTGNRVINFGGQYTSTSSSYLTVYGWLNSPLTEYYIIENWSYNACSVGGATQLGTVTSDGSQYQVCKHTQVNQPSIQGTSTFIQYISVRYNKRSSGTVTTANHFSFWAKNGFGNSNWNFQVFGVEAFGGSGSASLAVSG
jgi:endo-1,4-beta-xylanase